MNEILEIGASPFGEACAQAGTPDYFERSRKEILAFRRQLFRHAAANGVSLPESLVLYVKWNRHDYGTYYELAAKFPADDEKASDAAYWLEGNLPEKWDEEARRELGIEVES